MAVKGGASSQSELVALQKSYADLQERLEKLTESEKQALLSATNATKVFEAEKKAWQDQMKQLKVTTQSKFCFSCVLLVLNLYFVGAK